MTAYRTVSIRIPVGSQLDEHINNAARTAGSQSGAVLQLIESTQEGEDSSEEFEEQLDDLQREIYTLREEKSRYQRLSGELILFMAAQMEDQGNVFGGIDEQ